MTSIQMSLAALLLFVSAASMAGIGAGAPPPDCGADGLHQHSGDVITGDGDGLEEEDEEPDCD